jgi:hypothetical protein
VVTLEGALLDAREQLAAWGSDSKHDGLAMQRRNQRHQSSARGRWQRNGAEIASLKAAAAGGANC